MPDFLLLMAGGAMVTVVLGLWRALRGPGDADRMMAVQLLGSGGIAALMLLAAGSGNWAILDAALSLSVLAAFATVAFALHAPGRSR